MSTIDQEALRGVVEKALADLGKLPTGQAAPAAAEKKSCGCDCNGTGGGENGVFGCVDLAASAANDAFLKLKKLGVEGRSRAIEIVKGICAANTEAWADSVIGGASMMMCRSG